VAGAWRSLRYDLDRRQARGADDEETTDLIFPEYSAARPPRRMLAAGGFGLLAVAGAAGTYLAVASGLGLLIDDPSGGQNALPAAAGGPAAVQDFGGANLPVDEVVPPDGAIGVGKGDGKGKGEIVIVREGRNGGRITPAGRQAAVEEAGGGHAPAPAPKPSPTRTKPTVPGPGPTTRSPSPSASPSASPSWSPSPSPSPSETPSPSPSASDPGEGGGPADPPEQP
jgi:hypothetical protein